MTEVRPFSEEFAAGTATLYFRAMRGQTRHPGKALPAYFCEILLQNPWATPEIPSWVCLENGKLIGTLGIVPRPMEFRGQNIRAATITQFMVDPDHRRGGTGAKLLGRCVEGPQEMTWVDGAADPVHLVFHKACQAVPAHFYSLHWMRVLRPFENGRSFLTRFGTAGKVLHRVASLATIPADLAATRLPPFGARRPAVLFRSASTEELLACIEEIGWREPLRPWYDAASFAWLMEQAGRASALGQLRKLIVKDADGTDCGWLVYFAKAAGTAYLLQLGIRGMKDYEPVLRVLFADAFEQGCVVAKGPSRPAYLTTLTSNYCVFRHPESSALIHSRNPDLLNTVRLGEAALSGLDGERWQRFSTSVWDS
jgi:GNAT superfamily N-acetyltransferase